ncbi:MAG: preprotein translocase subunit SecE [Erysipelotrichaceae bacterium]|nr:preprotein translocase subunit SecE [Erysipelotrichaceae bacterium]
MDHKQTEEEKKALKAKLKQERKDLRAAKKLERQRLLEEQEDPNPLKLKEWLSLRGIRDEIKEVHWMTPGELAHASAIVLAFTFALGVYFYAADAVIALILKALGMN